MITDQERLENVLQEHGAYTKALANDLLGLVIEIAGERLIEKERSRAEIYRAILTNKMVKPEFTKTIYQLMQSAEEKTQ
jgi:hypothetical protein